MWDKHRIVNHGSRKNVDIIYAQDFGQTFTFGDIKGLERAINLKPISTGFVDDDNIKSKEKQSSTGLPEV